MREGLAGQIEFLGPDRIRRHGALTPTDVTLGGLYTVDVKWLVWEGLSPSSEHERICYVAQDGRVWWVRVRCQRTSHPPQHIETWFEHEREGGTDSHASKSLRFFDWEGSGWVATIQAVGAPLPSPPKFHLERVSQRRNPAAAPPHS